MDDTNLNEIFDALQRYESEDMWDRFLQDEFFKYNRQDRIAVMTGFSKLAQQEVKPNRTTAMWLNRQREMESMHRNLEFAGR